jgi:hypothetical protein
MSASPTASTTSSFYTSSSTACENHVPTFQEEFNLDGISTFNENQLAESIEYDRLMGFEPVSPIIHPNDPTSWLVPIPPAPTFFEDIQELAKQAYAPGPKTVQFDSVINLESTIYYHTQQQARYFLAAGSAPKTLDERHKNSGDGSWICYLIYLQIIFFGPDSLTPWQYTFFTELGDILSKDTCSFCKMIPGPWCSEIVLRE